MTTNESYSAEGRETHLNKVWDDSSSPNESKIQKSSPHKTEALKTEEKRQTIECIFKEENLPKLFSDKETSTSKYTKSKNRRDYLYHHRVKLGTDNTVQELKHSVDFNKTLPLTEKEFDKEVQHVSDKYICLSCRRTLHFRCLCGELREPEVIPFRRYRGLHYLTDKQRCLRCGLRFRYICVCGEFGELDGDTFRRELRHHNVDESRCLQFGRRLHYRCRLCREPVVAPLAPFGYYAADKLICFLCKISSLYRKYGEPGADSIRKELVLHHVADRTIFLDRESLLHCGCTCGTLGEREVDFIRKELGLYHVADILLCRSSHPIYGITFGEYGSPEIHYVCRRQLGLHHLGDTPTCLLCTIWHNFKIGRELELFFFLYV